MIPASSWKKYSIFGNTILSDYPFTAPLDPGQDHVDVTFTFTSSEKFPDDWKKGRPVYESPFKDSTGLPALIIYKEPTFTVLSFSEGIDFFLLSDQILFNLHVADHYFQVEGLFLSTVVAIWLELQDIYTCHCSAVILDGKVVAFVGDSRQGKSTLAASWVKRGQELFTDDILPIIHREENFWGIAGFPSMRLWPDQAQYFFGDYLSLPKADPESEKRLVIVDKSDMQSARPACRQMGCLYILSRQPQFRAGEPQIKIEPVAVRVAVMELLRFSFVSRSIEALGKQSERLQLLARLAAFVPVRRLVYPEGFEYLEAIQSVVMQDLGL